MALLHELSVLEVMEMSLQLVYLGLVLLKQHVVAGCLRCYKGASQVRDGLSLLGLEVPECQL